MVKNNPNPTLSGLWVYPVASNYPSRTVHTSDCPPWDREPLEPLPVQWIVNIIGPYYKYAIRSYKNYKFAVELFHASGGLKSWNRCLLSPVGNAVLHKVFLKSLLCSLIERTTFDYNVGKEHSKEPVKTDLHSFFVIYLLYIHGYTV